MSGITKIEWSDRVWNPVTGCTKVSPGCKNCYAETIAHRFWGARKFTDVRCHQDRLDEPLHWKKPARVFVNSMSDLFHEDVPDSFLAAVFHTMAQASWHTFQVLTKRPERMREWLSRTVAPRPQTNIWLGVSVENQETANDRIPILLRTPAAVRFLSIEPLLEPVHLEYEWLGKTLSHLNAVIDWVIVGGESGPKARHFDVDWARSIRDECRAANVAYFLKQLGSGRGLNDRNAADPSEWPVDLQDCREFPR
jgi:protein gp37